MAACLFINDLLEDLFKNLRSAVDISKAVIKPLRKTCALMLRDESGVMEPHADLLSVALAVIGFMVFAVLMSQTYFGYEDRSFALENYESASLLAESLADAPALEAENSGLLSATALDMLSGPEGINERAQLFATFSGNYQFMVEVRTGDSRWHWRVVPENANPEVLADGREKVAASVPVVIELNPAESVPGILTVVVYKTGWN